MKLNAKQRAEFKALLRPRLIRCKGGTFLINVQLPDCAVCVTPVADERDLEAHYGELDFTRTVDEQGIVRTVVTRPKRRLRGRKVGGGR